MLEDSSLIARRLIDSAWLLVASPAYLRQNGKPQHSRQLQYHNCLTYKYAGTGATTWHMQVNGIDYTEQVRGNFQANNLFALREGALADLGIAYLPKVAVKADLDSGALVEVLPEYSKKTVGIYAVYPRVRQLDQKIKLLIEHLRDVYQAQPDTFHHV